MNIMYGRSPSFHHNDMTSHKTTAGFAPSNRLPLIPLAKKRKWENTQCTSEQTHDIRCQECIGENVYLTVQYFKDVLRFDIRKWVCQDNGRDYPTKVGVNLITTRWKMLQTLTNTIDRELQQTTNPRKYHLGGLVMAEVLPRGQFLDIRKYWLPDTQDTPVPTRKGITLDLKQWNLLKFHLNTIHDKCVPELTELVDCMSSHQNQEGYFDCVECYPKGLDKIHLS